ncbi:MAG: LpqB family beta-propeller domain-containing protein [Candidatus Krumholzibacteriia bacterium]
MSTWAVSPPSCLARLLACSIGLAGTSAHGVQLVQLTRSGPTYNSDYSPAWMPGSLELVFVRSQIQGPPHWYYYEMLYELSLGGAVPLYSVPGNADPAVALDGTFAFASLGRDSTGSAVSGKIGVWRSGVGSRWLTDGAHIDREPAWSPGGTRIAFASNRDGAYHLWIVPTAGGSATQLTRGSSADRSPAWSPDGERIAFSSNRAGHLDLWIVLASGGEPRQLTDDDAEDAEPAWSPDGRFLVFASNRAGNWDLWVVNVETRGLSQVTASPSRDEEPAWSPDGSRIAFVSGGLLWLATDLGTVNVAPATWSAVKQLYRD